MDHKDLGRGLGGIAFLLAKLDELQRREKEILEIQKIVKERFVIIYQDDGAQVKRGTLHTYVCRRMGWASNQKHYVDKILVALNLMGVIAVHTHSIKLYKHIKDTKPDLPDQRVKKVSGRPRKDGTPNERRKSSD